MYYFDIMSNSLKSYAPTQQIPSTVVDGDRLAIDYYIDGTDKKAFFYFLPATMTYMLRTLFISRSESNEGYPTTENTIPIANTSGPLFIE
jgi:hypothetical protein